MPPLLSPGASLPLVLPIRPDDGEIGFGPRRRSALEYLCAVFLLRPTTTQKLKSLKAQLDHLVAQYPDSPKHTLSVQYSDINFWWVTGPGRNLESTNHADDLPSFWEALQEAEKEGLGQRFHKKDFERLQADERLLTQDRVTVVVEQSQDEVWFSLSWVYLPDNPNLHMGSFRWRDILESDLLWAPPGKIQACWKALAEDSPGWALRWLQIKPKIQAFLYPEDLAPLLGAPEEGVRQQALRQARHVSK